MPTPKAHPTRSAVLTAKVPRTATAYPRAGKTSRPRSTGDLDPRPDVLDILQDPELLRRLLRAKDRMDVASHEDWPVRRLARLSGVSEAHFARSFKQAFGVPPHRYLLTRRIERASAMLRDTGMSITEIAFHTGWASLGTFGRTFRDVTGVSPSAARVRGRATACDLGCIPPCFLTAAHRPDLAISVLEKRRRLVGGITAPEQKEVV
jgi:AraC-like DNA-binding protein